MTQKIPKHRSLRVAARGQSRGLAPQDLSFREHQAVSIVADKYIPRAQCEEQHERPEHWGDDVCSAVARTIDSMLGGRHLSTTALALGLTIAWEVRESGGPIALSYCDISRRIAIRSPHTLRAALRELDREGYVRVEQRTGKVATYRLLAGGAHV